MIPQPINDPLLRIICFPYAGGNASTYLHWEKWLPENVELIAVQPPGRAARMFEPCYTDMGSLVNELLTIVSDLFDRPYILFGHSLGSRIAFELMIQCKIAGFRLPQHLIASGSRGPHIPSKKEPIHHLAYDDFVARLTELNGTPTEILENKELMELYLPLLRADFKLAETYSCTSNHRFDCSISVLGGDNDTDVTNDDLQSWGDFFSNPANVHLIAGGHFFIETNKSQIEKKVTMIIQNELLNLEGGKSQSLCTI